MELSDNELFSVYRDLKSEQRSQSQVRPIDRKGGRKNLYPLKNKALPHVLKVLEDTKSAAQRGDFSSKAELSYQTLKAFGRTNSERSSFDPVFGPDGVMAQTPKQSVGTDALFMYMNAAAKALETVETHDPSAAQTLSQVMDFLAAESVHHTLSDQIQMLFLQRDQLKTKVDGQQILLDKQQVSISDLQTEIQSMRDRVIEGEIKLQLLQREKRELLRIIEMKDKKIEKQKKITDNLADQSHQLSELNDGLARQNNEKERNIQKMFRDAEQKLLEFKALNQKLNELKHINTELLSQNTFLQQKVIEAEAEIRIIKEKAGKDTDKALLQVEKLQQTEANLKLQCEQYEEEIVELKRQLVEEKHKNKFQGTSGGSGSLHNSQSGNLRDPVQQSIQKDRYNNRYTGKNGFALSGTNMDGYRVIGAFGGMMTGGNGTQFGSPGRFIGDLPGRRCKSAGQMCGHPALSAEELAKLAEDCAEEIAQAMAAAEQDLQELFGIVGDSAGVNREKGMNGLLDHIRRLAEQLGISFEDALKLPQVQELLKKLGVEPGELLELNRAQIRQLGGILGKRDDLSSDYEELVDENGRIIKVRKNSKISLGVELLESGYNGGNIARVARRARHHVKPTASQGGGIEANGNDKGVWSCPRVTASACQCDLGVDLTICICQNCKKILENTEGADIIGKHRIKVEDPNDLLDGNKLFDIHLQQKAEEEDFLKKEHQRLIRFKIDRFIKARTALLNNFKKQTAVLDKINQIEVHLTSKPEIINLNQQKELQKLKEELKQLQHENPRLEQEFLGLQEYYIDVSQLVIRNGQTEYGQYLPVTQIVQKQVEDDKPIDFSQYLPQGVRLWLTEEQYNLKQKNNADIVSDTESTHELSDSQESKQQNFTNKDMNRLKALIELTAIAQEDPTLSVQLTKQHQEQLGISIKTSDGVKVTQLVNKLMHKLHGKIRKASLTKGLQQLQIERLEALKVAGDYSAVKKMKEKFQMQQSNDGINTYDLTDVNGSMIIRVVQRPIYSIVGQKLINPLMPAVKQRNQRLKRQARRQNKLLQEQLKELKNDLGRLSPLEKYSKGSDYADMLQTKQLLTTLKVNNIQEVKEKQEKAEKIKKQIQMQPNSTDQQVIDWYQPENVLSLEKSQNSNLITLQEQETPTEFITKRTPILKLQNKDLYQLKEQYYLDNNEYTDEQNKGKTAVGIGGEITWVLYDSQFQTALVQFRHILGKEHTLDLDIDSYKYAQIPYGTLIKDLYWTQQTIIIFYQFLVSNDGTIDLKSKSNFNQLLSMWIKREYNNKQILVKLMYHLLINTYFWENSCSLIKIFKLLMYGQISYNYFFIYIEIYKFIVHSLLGGKTAQIQSILDLKIDSHNISKLSMGIIEGLDKFYKKTYSVFDFLSQQIMYIRNKRKEIGALILQQFKQMAGEDQSIAKWQFIQFSQKCYGNQVQYDYSSIPQKLSQTQFFKNMGKFEAQASGCFDKLEDMCVALKQIVCQDQKIEEMFMQTKNDLENCALIVLRKFRLVAFIYDVWRLQWDKQE